MKYIYSRSPQINGFDTTSFIGYFIVPTYYIAGKYAGVDMSIFSLQPKVALILGARLFTGMMLNITITNGLMYVPVSKGVLIFCLNPLFCAIVAAIFLKENITFISIGSTIGAFCGIYLLTLNKSDEVKEDSHELLGYTLVLGSAWCYGLLFVFLRALNLYNLHILISPLYLGVVT